MKTVLLLVSILMYLLIPKSYSQEQIKILTPLGNQRNDKTYPIKNSYWDDAKVESCRQAWLLEGGVFLRDEEITNDIKFLEKNNYLKDLRGKCLLINGNNLYLGTENGIYLSANSGETWLSWDKEQIDNLENKIIYDLSMQDNNIFACTNYGLFKSTNDGESWSQLRTYSTRCVKFEGSNIIYAGGEAGLYKSTDGGSNWTLKLSRSINCIYLSEPLVYAGDGSDIFKGLWRSSDNGDTWLQIYSDDIVTEIFLDGSAIYLGTLVKGVQRSTNGGISFTNFRVGLPMINASDYYRINSIQKYDNQLYAGTENELYRYNEIYSEWERIPVFDHYWNREYEKLIKRIYTEGENLWIVCSKSDNPKFPTATMVTDYNYPMNPNNFNTFNCHGFAWHLVEGGENGIELDAPKSQRYIPQDNASDWERINWDYIEADSWQDPEWEKVKYQADHSGIKSPNMISMPENENDLIIISKWNFSGPLVEHKLRDCILSGGTPKYYKSKKEISGEITDDRRIGRQLVTEQSSNNITTYIPEDDSVNFYVAPMYNNKIHLKSGFQAKYGSNFHAFVKNYYIQDNNVKPCKIPWVEESTLLFAQKDTFFEAETKAVFAEEISSDLSNAINNGKDKSIEKIKLNEVSFTRIDTQPCHKYFDPFTYSGKGSGTKEDPYQITKIEDFLEYFNDRDGDHYWILMNDLDGSITKNWGYRFSGGGDSIFTGFEGLSGSRQRQLDGQGYKIKNLFKSFADNFAAGLNCFTLKRIGFENITLRVYPNIDHPYNLYLLLQDKYRNIDFTMEECYFTGTVTAPMVIDDDNQDYENYGIYSLGQFFYNTKIKNCYVDLHIITNGVMMPTVDIPNDTVNRDVVVENVYSKVTTTTNKKIHSPFGYYGNIISCFWDDDIIKITEPLGKGIGLPTSEMKKREPFEKAGWDFENVWYIEEGVDYPKLRAFNKQLSAEKVKNVNEYSLTVSEVQQTSNFKINYELPVAGSVEIELYSSIGSKVQLLLSESNVQGGSYSINFDGSALSSGLYFVVMKTSKEMLSQKIIIIN